MHTTSKQAALCRLFYLRESAPGGRGACADGLFGVQGRRTSGARPFGAGRSEARAA